MDSRQARMVAGMRPRMPPPSMLSTVMSRPWDGGGHAIVASESLPMFCSTLLSRSALTIASL